MSKYTACISVIDEGGNIAFERELGTDEIIGELIERINFFQKPPEPGEAIVVGPHNIGRIVKETKKALEKPIAKVKKGKRTVTCKNCGEQGHIAKTCPQLKQVSGPQPFSESTYGLVKRMLENGAGVDGVVADKGFAAEEVRQIRDSKTYDDYRRKHV